MTGRHRCITTTTAPSTSVCSASRLIATGLLALNFPVFIDAFDQFGFQIKCGTGYFANLTQAAEASGGDYVGQCETALMLRRLWTIPLVAIGSILLAVIVVGGRHRVGP